MSQRLGRSSGRNQLFYPHFFSAGKNVIWLFHTWILVQALSQAQSGNESQKASKRAKNQSCENLLHLLQANALLTPFQRRTTVSSTCLALSRNFCQKWQFCVDPRELFFVNLKNSGIPNFSSELYVRRIGQNFFCRLRKSLFLKKVAAYEQKVSLFCLLSFIDICHQCM